MKYKLIRRALLVSCSALACSTAASAQSVRKGVVVSVDAEANSNPYLGVRTGNSNSGDNTDIVGAGNIKVSPWLSADDETSSFRLEAFAQARAFTSRYDTDDSYGARMAVTKRPNERTTLYANASINSRSARSRYYNLITPTAPLDPTVNPGQPEVPPAVLPIDDITLLGASSRTTSINVAAGSNMQLSPRSSFGANVGYQKLMLGSVNGVVQGTDYDTANAGLTYSYALSQRTSIGVSTTGSFTRYQDGYPDATTVSVLANLNTTLSQYWSLSGDIGVSSAHSQSFGVYPASTNTYLAGGASLCNKQERRHACLSYRRSQQPSSLGSIRKTDAVHASYSEQLSERNRISLNSGYTRNTGEDRFNTGFSDFELLSLSATFTRSIDKRVEGYVFGNASRSWGGYLSRDPSYAVGVGLTIRLGDIG